MCVLFIDDDNFEPQVAQPAASNKWEGEDEEDDIKVK